MWEDKPKTKERDCLVAGEEGAQRGKQSGQQFSNAPVQKVMTSGTILMFHMLKKQK